MTYFGDDAIITMKVALEQISERHPPLPDGFDIYATLSDFGGNGGDYAQHVDTLVNSSTGDIARAALAAATGTAKTAKRVECEASQSGGKAVTPNPNRINTHPNKGEDC